MLKLHGFVDGAFLREVAMELEIRGLPDPRMVVDIASKSRRLRITDGEYPYLQRVSYYDARPDDEVGADSEYEEYWKAIELLPDTDLAFGVIKSRRKRKQKGVDTLLSVDMLVGAFTGLYDIAVLVAGDADFVPVVNEVKRRGATVVLVSHKRKLSDDLRRSVDRVIFIEKEAPRADPNPNVVALRVLAGFADAPLT